MADTILNQATSLGRHKDAKRVGRGKSAGGGKTAGRGTKGQKARTGGQVPAYFEGGQKPLTQRLPKKHGFKHIRSFEIKVLNVGDLQKWAKDGEITLEVLKDKRFLKNNDQVKVLGNGKVDAGIKKVEAHYFSTSALKALEEAKAETKVAN